MTSTTRRTEDVLIFRGDDSTAIAAALEDFNRSISEESIITSRRLPEERPSTMAARAYDAAVAEATPRATVATVQALGRKTYRRLRAAHPPIDDNARHQALGYNPDTFYDALLEFFDTDTGEKTLVAPEFGARQPLIDWLDELNDGNFSQLSAAALRVNEGGSPDPKASLSSQVGRLYGETSPPPASTD